jgi:thiosulfate reductase cytochrome b subunit
MDTKKMIHWALFAAIFIYILTGLGILYPGVIEPLTLGLLGKAVSFQVHFYLIFPFLLLLGAHMYFTLMRKRRK